MNLFLLFDDIFSAHNRASSSYLFLRRTLEIEYYDYGFISKATTDMPIQVRFALLTSLV